MIGPGTTCFAGFIEPGIARTIWNQPGVVAAGQASPGRGCGYRAKK
jgi:hypothetical protein